MALDGFHPTVRAWFERALGEPTPPQSQGWPGIVARQHTLIAAPTGSGKTLAAFLSAIDDLVKLGLQGQLPERTRVVYVSPLKALSNDIERNLQGPLRGIQEELQRLGLPEVPIRTAVRTGDTPASRRAAFTKRPPQILVTTPESLYILLTSEGGRKALGGVETLIVDEIHALVGSKRGSHLSLSMERLQALTERPLTRIGLSATQRPIEAVGRFLVGEASSSPNGACHIVDLGHTRRTDLQLELPASPLEPVMALEVWEELYDRVAQLIQAHSTTLVFVNTRRLAERLTLHLSERLGEGAVTSHHGSLSREQRLRAEQQLKHGELRALVATASMELGIDVGDVELVCQIGSPRSIAGLLQRVGRSGHFKGGLPKGRLFPTSRDDLVECAALLDAAGRGQLDRVCIPEQPLDILAQQIVAMVAAEPWQVDELFACLRKAHPYRALERARFDQVIRMLSEGFRTGRGRRGAYLHHDAVNGWLRPRRSARLAAITSGGAIPDNADYQVIQEPAGTRVGTVNEDFAVESLSGDIFQLGNGVWKILRVETGKVRVEDAAGQPPSIPFWLGEAPGRTDELSEAVSALREQVDALLQRLDAESAAQHLAEARPLPLAATRQLVEYLGSARAALGGLPSQRTLVMERFFDEAGGMQLVVHAPFGSRLNRAWGLALRKRFCRSFNFELQAAATDDAIVISLGPTHSFPLEDVFHFLRSESVEALLAQAVLDAPMFETRWRWNASRALAVLRFRGGRKVPPYLQRMLADDLLATAFPDQLACLENVQGDREIPDHPLVQQTLADCLHEAMDVEGLQALLASIERGEKQLVARELTEPSPLAHEILGARPYAYLDDAPLEERRTLAVSSRRFLSEADAASIGALDADAIARVREEAWPRMDDAEELHDALLLLGVMTTAELAEHDADLCSLMDAGRAVRLQRDDASDLFAATERLPQARALFASARVCPETRAPEGAAACEDETQATREIVRSRAEHAGPLTAEHLAGLLGLPVAGVEAALAALEAEGVLMRGRYTPGVADEEWCERGLLSRIHRYTLQRLRREIEPVSAQDFMRFLLAWQRVDEEHRMQGMEGLADVLQQLEGFEAPAVAWEADILPARVEGYDPAWLDALCLSGQLAWARLSAPQRASSPRPGRRPVRSTPIAWIPREERDAYCGRMARDDDEPLSSSAVAVQGALQRRGACFFGDLVGETGLLPSQLEEALAELVAQGRVTADSFAGLRALLLPASKRPRPASREGRGRRSPRLPAPLDMKAAGRWSLLIGPESQTPRREADDPVEASAWALLRRYGVVFRKLLARERTPPWRELLRVYRRMEARGELRGGRFVAGFSGEQYALPEAVPLLRRMRKQAPDGAWVSLGAADPLCLMGVLTPGPRLPAAGNNRVLFRDGVPVAVQEGGEVRFLEEVAAEQRWQAHTTLLRRKIPPTLRAYLERAS